jgi:hypothetical protein
MLKCNYRGASITVITMAKQKKGQKKSGAKSSKKEKKGNK